MKTTRQQLLIDFGVKTTKELNKEQAFKIMLLNICKHRGEEYRYWKSSRNGFILITNQSFLEFEWKDKEYNCIVDSLIYS